MENVIGAYKTYIVRGLKMAFIVRQDQLFLRGNLVKVTIKNIDSASQTRKE